MTFKLIICSFYFFNHPGGRVVWIDASEPRVPPPNVAQTAPRPFPSPRLNDPAQSKKVQAKRLRDSVDILPTILGPVSLAPFISSGGPVTRASDLNCDFTSSCCWTNIESPRDELDWLTVTSNLDQSRAQSLFQTSQLPRPPFIMTATPSTNSRTYAVLQSCTINCQSDQGILNFNKWTSQGVSLDVCVLPVGSTQYSYCQTVSPGSQALVSIPPQSQPFQIMITASEFTNPPGGAAAIDDITYSATLCPTTGGPVPPGGISQICQAITCNMNTLCSYTTSGCGSNNFVSKVGPTGDSNGGIPMGPGSSNEYYAAAVLPPNSKALLQSQRFTTDQPLTVNFKYFDSGNTAYKVCIDGDPNCPFSVVPSGTSMGQWKDGSFTVPPGTHTVYFLACHASGSTSYAGIDNVYVSSYGSTQNPCPNQKKKQQS